MSSKECEVIVLEQFCKGCGLCVEFCDRGKLRLRQKPNKQGIQPAVVREDIDCTGCMRCATICPDAAIEIRQLQGSAGASEDAE